MKISCFCLTALTMVAATTPLQATTGPAGLPLPLACSGSEPFWGLTIRDESWAEYTWDNQKTLWHVESVGNAMMRPTTWRVVFKGRGRHALIFRETQGCSDTDSDKPPEYSLLLEDGDGFLQGCCAAPP